MASRIELRPDGKRKRRLYKLMKDTGEKALTKAIYAGLDDREKLIEKLKEVKEKLSEERKAHDELKKKFEFLKKMSSDIVYNKQRVELGEGQMISFLDKENTGKNDD